MEILDLDISRLSGLREYTRVSHGGDHERGWRCSKSDPVKTGPTGLVPTALA